MKTTHKTDILDAKYTVRTVTSIEDGQQFVTIFITNNENGVLLGGESTKKAYDGSVESLHKGQVQDSIEVLNHNGRWQVRVAEGETTVTYK